MRKPVKHKNNYFVASTENRRAKSRQVKKLFPCNQPARPFWMVEFVALRQTAPRAAARRFERIAGNNVFHPAPVCPRSFRPLCAGGLHDPQIPQRHPELATHRSTDSLVREFPV
jgi:hypothetical protein